MSAATLCRRDVEELISDKANRSTTLRGARLADADLSHLDLSKLDLSGADLSRADLSGTDLSGANLAKAKLTNAVLYGACLAEAELIGADASRANFSNCDASRAGFGAARLDGASFFEATLVGTSFSQATLKGADLRCANLCDARLHACDLEGVDASRADLREAELDESRVPDAVFDGADLRHTQLRGIKSFVNASFLYTDIRDTDFRGSYAVRRRIIDENYLHEFRNRNRHSQRLYALWWATSDCGRSFWRWGAWTGLMVLLFAAAYSQVEIDFGDYETPLSPLYFSVVTLTTLGYGDVLPKSMAAQCVTMIEVVVGYVALGGLLSILSNKMGRRGE